MSATLSKRQERPAARTFIAVELPADLKNRIAGIRSRFGETGQFLRWTQPPQLHITLRFLGDVDRGRLADVVEAASRAASRSTRFSVCAEGLGGFPNERSPRVLWVGIADDEGKGRLSRLFDALENGLVSRGFRREARPFSPHLTIARTRDLSSRDRSAVGEALRACQNELNLKVAVDVDHVTVFESVLSPRGATYASLAELPLELDNSAKSLR